MINKEEYYSTKEVASLYGIDKKTLFSLIKLNKLNPIRGGRNSYLFTKEEIDSKSILYKKKEIDKTKYLVQSEACKLLGISSGKLWSMWKKGYIRTQLMNNTNYYLKEELLSFIKPDTICICIGCGKEFIREAAHQGFCTKDCQKLWNKYDKKNKRENRKTLKMCSWCGKEFYTNNKKQHCCCKKCGKAYFNKKLFGRKIFTKKCKHCKNEFTIRGSTQDFCSISCRKEYNKVIINNNKKNTINICAFCSKEFIAKSINHKYCCGECQRDYYLGKNILSNRGTFLKTCLCCGKEYSAHKSNSKFCGTNCSNTYTQGNRKKVDELFRFKCDIRTFIGKSFDRKNFKKKYTTEEILGSSLVGFKDHLEKLFYDNPRNGEKMTWENKGMSGWHIDHIKELKYATTEEEVIKLCHYTNLRPLWWFDNLARNKKNG